MPIAFASVAANGNALYFRRADSSVRQTEDSPVRRLNGKTSYSYHHLGLYAYRRPFLLSYKNLPVSLLEKLEQFRALEAGYAIKVGIVQSNPPGIDTPEDYEAFLARMKSPPSSA